MPHFPVHPSLLLVPTKPLHFGSQGYHMMAPSSVTLRVRLASHPESESSASESGRGHHDSLASEAGSNKVAMVMPVNSSRCTTYCDSSDIASVTLARCAASSYQRAHITLSGLVPAPAAQSGACVPAVDSSPKAYEACCLPSRCFSAILRCYLQVVCSYSSMPQRLIADS